MTNCLPAAAPAHQALRILLLICLAWPAVGEDATPAHGLVNPSSSPRDFYIIGKHLYFAANDGIHGRELWYCDEFGTCRMAIDFRPGPASSKVLPHSAAGDSLFCTTRNESDLAEFWLWSDERQRATLLYRSTLSADVSRPCVHECFGAARNAYIALRDPRNAWNLWVLPPGATALRQVTDWEGRREFNSAFCGTQDNKGIDYFIRDNRLWKSDGTKPGTLELLESEMADGTEWIRTINGGVVAVLRTDAYGREPWFTDGSRSGTFLLRDIRPGPGTSMPSQQFVWNGRLYFGADDGDHGKELWVTDGTTQGTVMLADICPGKGSSDPHYFSGTSSRLYFSADDGLHGEELWCIDGTPGGTLLVQDLEPDTSSSSPYELAVLNDTFYFCATTRAYGDAIWTTDGTSAGTRLVVDVMPGPGPGGPDNLIGFLGKLIFTYDEPTYGEELWVYDPSTGKYSLLADINVPRFNPSTSPRDLTAAGRLVYFVAADPVHGQELWVTDGEEEHTRIVSDLNPGPNDSAPNLLTAGDALLYFAASTAQYGQELWVTEERGENALPIDLHPGADSSAPTQLLWFDHALYFTADDGKHGRELWTSDGTPQATRLVCDFTPGRDGTEFDKLFATTGELFAYITTSAGLGLYQYDRQSYGLHLLQLIRQEGNTAPALRPDASPQKSWLTQAFPCAPTGEAEALQVGTTIYFAYNTPETGSELWSTDGTQAGTHLVCDAYPGRAGSSPRQLTEFDGRVLFIGDHPGFGPVLWSTDGTVRGSEVIRPSTGADVLPPIPASRMIALNDCLYVIAQRPAMPPRGAQPIEVFTLHKNEGLYSISDLGALPECKAVADAAYLVSNGLQVFFLAKDDEHGCELWTMKSPDHPMLVKDILVPGDLLPLRR